MGSRIVLAKLFVFSPPLARRDSTAHRRDNNVRARDIAIFGVHQDSSTRQGLPYKDIQYYNNRIGSSS